MFLPLQKGGIILSCRHPGIQAYKSSGIIISYGHCICHLLGTGLSAAQRTAEAGRSLPGAPARLYNTALGPVDIHIAS